MTITPDAPPVTTSVGHTFVCYARDDEAFVLDVVEGLRSRGVPVWFDQWNIEAGADWSQAIEKALHTCRNVLIVLSPQAVTSDEVRGELRVALDNRKRVIPVLYRPTHNIPGRLRIKQHLDFTRFAENRETLLDQLAGELQSAAKDRGVAATRERDLSSRRTLLADVSSEVGDRLASLGTRAPVPILLEPQPHQVARSWDDEVGITARPRPMPPTTDIVEVFDGAAPGGSLLILGAPGSGKTTVLLQLLQALVARADLDERRAIPVLVSLASWKRNKTIGEWLVDELKVKHGVRTDHSARWCDERKLTPLLDGLDELPPELQQACVEAINDFHHVYKPPCLVVCCRVGEYENFSVKLRLRRAVCLLALDADQIRAYLDQAGATDLWNVIAADPGLMEMARSPLLLSFMCELPREPVAQGLESSDSAERRQRLFDAYLAWRLPAASTRATYSDAQTRRWLKHLARILRRHGLSEFLIERMQPDWLDSAVQRWLYRAVVLIVSAVTVMLVELSLSSVLDLIPEGNVGRALARSPLFQMPYRGSTVDLTLLLSLGIIVGSIIASRRTIVPIETLTWSWSRAATNMRRWSQAAVVTGLDYAIPLGVAGSLIWHWSRFNGFDDAWRTAATFAGTVASVFVAVSLALVRPRLLLERPWRQVMKPRITAAAAAAVLWALVTGLSLTWTIGLLAGIGLFLIVAFSAALNDRCRMMLLRWLAAGTVSGVTVAALSWAALSGPVPLLLWFSMSTASAMTVAVIAGLMTSFTIRLREWRGANDRSTIVTADRPYIRPMAIALGMGIALGVAALISAWAGSDQPTRSGLLFAYNVHSGFVTSLFAVVFIVVNLVAGVGAMLAVLGGLAGALSGATGADVERRLVPNQGIRQSARNVVVFGALGTLIIGVPYGLFNLSLASVVVWTIPTWEDWLEIAVAPGFYFGLLAGLLPGAACIQHFVLRFVLWSSGTLPLRCGRFMNFATRRRLLQRVGGRYGFIHVLLRDHLADAPQTRATGWSSLTKTP